MEEIRIPNEATYSPVSLTDLIATAPLASRLLLGATLPGRVLSAAALGMYAGSALKDWVQRRDVRWIDFQQEFGCDVKTLTVMPEAARREDIERVGRRLEGGYTDERIPRKELAVSVNGHLTEFIAEITGQRVHTSSEVRDFTLAKLVFPFAMGVCDVISGDVALFRDTGIFEPHIVCHEFVHRKGYWKELHAQAISYMALMRSGDPVLVQAALAERLHRQLKVMAGDDHQAYHDMVDQLALRQELADQLHQLRPDPGVYESSVSVVMKKLYDERMKLTGQNGLSDYDEGFTNFLWTFSQSASARQEKRLVAV
ncbi:MAG: DUF3810 family protein [Gemmatimonadetes bacterium]|nr:DUF3810 family protein [Gemmatimonadota bacterium]NNF13682.1 DUF3810 family protein [Gemmatimonadota bacterium]NNL30771.1 DUF3810 family protein [Gemmatimonadota bacterium]